MSALPKLDYPDGLLTVIFIDDGSTDSSTDFLRNRVAGKRNWYLLSLGQSVGKAAALNRALDTFSPGEIVAIYDADECPQPDALKRLIYVFEAGSVGGVSGRRIVVNPLDSPAASYTAFEGLVHQLVTMRAKDRLNLAPALLGSNCAYRRQALAQAGNFESGALLEDSDLTLKLARSGWQLRFEPKAVSYHDVPRTISGYWRQHTRWARGFNEVAKTQLNSVLFADRLPLPLRLELVFFAWGYLDRLALLLAGALLFLGRIKRPLTWIVPLSLVTPLLQIVAALRIDRAPLALWARLIWVPVFFAIDMAMAATGFWHTLKKSPPIWEERRIRT
jgi:cellulose synthase/poly-beta-1,6-N-acetylglucosamine synthase-like glycosyltransferase